MKREHVISEKVLQNGRYTIKFKKESSDINRVEVFDSNFGSIVINSSCVSRDFGNYYYKLFKEYLREGRDWTNLIDTFSLDSIAYNDDYDFYSDVFKDIYGHRPHYSKDQWETRVKTARSLNVGLITV